jgi:hypothetical protein
MTDSPTVIFLLDGSDFRCIEANPFEIVPILRAQADTITTLRHQEAARVLKD